MRLPGILLIAALGCSPGRPSEQLAQVTLNARIDGGSGERVSLIEFEKTDGQMAEVMGVEVYRIDFRARAQARADLLYKTAGFFGGNVGSLETRAKPQSQEFWDQWFSTMVASERPACKGDVFQLRGAITFEAKESGWNPAQAEFSVTLDSTARSVDCQISSRGARARAPTRPATPAPIPIDELSLSRCAQYATAHPLPRPSFFQRLLGRRRSIAASLPDTTILVSSEARVGTISFTPTGEVCLGPNPIPFPVTSGMSNYPLGYKLILSRPSPQGHRVLTFSQYGLESRDARFSAWIVHPDSQHVLSTDLLSTLTLGAAAYLPQPSQWSPDGSRVVMLQSWTADKGPAIALLMTSLPDTSAPPTTLDLWHDYQYTEYRADTSSFRWTASDVVQVTLYGTQRTLQETGCVQSSDSLAFTIDVARNHASTPDQALGDNVPVTVLGCFAANGDSALVAQLLRSGVNVNEGFGYKYSSKPLIEAAGRGRLAVVRILLAAGAHIDDSEEGSGLTALGAAASAGHTPTVHLLLSAGARLTGGGDFDPVPPLHAAAAAGQVEAARILLDAGADPTEIQRGKSAIDLARDNNHASTLSLLQTFRKGRSPQNYGTVT